MWAESNEGRLPMWDELTRTQCVPLALVTSETSDGQWCDSSEWLGVVRVCDAFVAKLNVAVKGRVFACALYDVGTSYLPLHDSLLHDGHSLGIGVVRHCHVPCTEGGMAKSVWGESVYVVDGWSPPDRDGVTVPLTVRSNGMPAGGRLNGHTFRCVDPMFVPKEGENASTACIHCLMDHVCRYMGAGSMCCRRPELAFVDYAAFDLAVTMMFEAMCEWVIAKAAHETVKGGKREKMPMAEKLCSRDADDFYSHMADAEGMFHCHGTCMTVRIADDGPYSNGWCAQSKGPRPYQDSRVSGLAVNRIVTCCCSEKVKVSGTNVSCTSYHLYVVDRHESRDETGTSATDESMDVRSSVKSENDHYSSPLKRYECDSCISTCCYCNYFLTATRLSGNETRELCSGKVNRLSPQMNGSESVCTVCQEDLMCLMMMVNDNDEARCLLSVQPVDAHGPNHCFEYHGVHCVSRFKKFAAGIEMTRAQMSCGVHQPDPAGKKDGCWGSLLFGCIHADHYLLLHGYYVTKFVDHERVQQDMNLPAVGSPLRMVPDHPGLFHASALLVYELNHLDLKCQVEVSVEKECHGCACGGAYLRVMGAPDSVGPTKDEVHSHSLWRCFDALIVYTSLYRNRLDCAGKAMFAHAHVLGDEAESPANGALQGCWKCEKGSRCPCPNEAAHQLGEARVAVHWNGVKRVEEMAWIVGVFVWSAVMLECVCSVLDGEDAGHAMSKAADKDGNSRLMVKTFAIALALGVGCPYVTENGDEMDPIRSCDLLCCIPNGSSLVSALVMLGVMGKTLAMPMVEGSVFVMVWSDVAVFVGPIGPGEWRHDVNGCVPAKDGPAWLVALLWLVVCSRAWMYRTFFCAMLCVEPVGGFVQGGLCLRVVGEVGCQMCVTRHIARYGEDRDRYSPA